MLRYALSLVVATALLTGCGTPSAMPLGPGMATNTDRGESWMVPQKKGRRSILIYAGGIYGDVYVFDYSTGKQVGKLAGINGDSGMCVDAKGDVYIDQMVGTALEYAHGGTKVLRTYSPGATPVGCSVDAKNDLAVTHSGKVTVYAGGDPSKGKTYSDPSCPTISKMGYDDKGNLIGAGWDQSTVSVCALLAGSKAETTLSTSGFTINAPAGTMWDGKYVALTDQNYAGGEFGSDDGIVEASLSDTTLTSHGEPVLTDTCMGSGTDIVSPFILGERNTPVNHRQGKVIVAINTLCTASGVYQIEFWRYPHGGKPFKAYKVKMPLGAVGAVSIES
jgi:hypothetical protein